jgi:serine/threonine protein kinase
MTTHIGTPHWMAPEILRGQKYDYSADVYSFGMLLFELMTDTIPWAGLDPVAVIKLVADGRERPQIPSNAPEKVASLIKLCWRDPPAKRLPFPRIYHLFQSHQVAFPDTDPERVRRLDARLRKFESAPQTAPPQKIAGTIESDTDSSDIDKHQSVRSAGSTVGFSHKLEHEIGNPRDVKRSLGTVDGPIVVYDFTDQTEDGPMMVQAPNVGGPEPGFKYTDRRHATGQLPVVRLQRAKTEFSSHKRLKGRPGIDMNVLGNISSDSFKFEMKKATQLLQKGQSREFFTAIANHFNEKTDTEMYRFILKQVAAILRNRFAIAAFADLKLHRKLPISVPELFDSAMEVLLVLFREMPQLFQNEYDPEMSAIIAKNPRKAIILLALFAQSFELLDNAWTLLDLMIKRQSAFLGGPGGPEFISTIFHLCSRHSRYREARLNHCMDIFVEGLSSDNANIVRLCYNSLFAFSDRFNPELDIDRLSDHLRDDTIQKSALSVLLKQKPIPRVESLVIALLESAQSSTEASSCLIKIAVRPDGAALLVKHDGWLSRKLPTLEHTFRLFLTVLCHETIRSEFLARSACTQFLIVLFESTASTQYLGNISSLLRYIDLESDLVIRFARAKVFDAVFRAASRANEELAIKAALEIVGVCAQVHVLPENELILNEIPEWLDRFPGLGGIVMPVLTILSRDLDYARKIKDKGLHQLFQKRFANHPKYGAFAEEFLNNVK